MRRVDRYITYYKFSNDESIDIIEYDRLNETMSISRNVDWIVLGSVDENDNYYVEIDLPDYIFDLVASSIEKTRLKDSIVNNINLFNLYSNLKGKRIDLVIERKHKIYFTSVSNYKGTNYTELKTNIDYIIMKIIIKQLDKLGYRDITDKLCDI